ncbi:MAG TPA: hypothetical protein VHZ07_18480 [Bryobacteraceae bacterium]|jgi:hypothetical protein|nr:hypothetical protein [Bryobacteraceae bacterium]
MKRFSVLGSAAILGVALCLASASCGNNPNSSAEQEQSSSDPAQANLAPAGSAVPVQQASTSAPQPPPSQQTYAQQPQPSSANQSYDQNYAAGTDDTDSGEQPVYADQPPPPIPEYTQPACPGENYIWTPGYWAYASQGYYWVPGAWMLAPFVGALWTPPYWAYVDQHYRWYHGYWAPHIGFYGGINYGFGYVGRGYEGGYWNRDVFHYNRVVNNVNANVIHNVYNYRISNFTQSKVSYDGGRDGLNVRPTPNELAVLHERRIAPLPAQVQHRQQSAQDRAQFEAVNHGRPQTFAAARPLATEYRAPAARPAAVPGARVLPSANAHQEVAPTPQRQEARPNPTAQAPQPRNEQRPAQQRQLEQRPAPQARQETRPAPQPRMEQRPAPQARQEAHPTPQARPEQRPAAQPKAEERPVPQRPAQQTRPEARPAPQAREQARPAPHPQSKPAPKNEEQREHPQ